MFQINQEYCLCCTRETQLRVCLQHLWPSQIQIISTNWKWFSAKLPDLCAIIMTGMQVFPTCLMTLGGTHWNTVAKLQDWYRWNSSKWGWGIQPTPKTLTPLATDRSRRSRTGNSQQQPAAYSISMRQTSPWPRIPLPWLYMDFLLQVCRHVSTKKKHSLRYIQHCMDLQLAVDPYKRPVLFESMDWLPKTHSQSTYFCKSNINQTYTNGGGMIWGVRIAIFTEIRHLVEELITFLSFIGLQKLGILTARLNESLSISTSNSLRGD